jgi:glycosyltransferase involved in cell wall biosynthesis
MAITNKKKLLILVDWFAPGFKAGGPIQSCVNLCRVLNSSYDIYVLTTDTDHGDTRSYPGIVADKWIWHEELKVNVYYAAKKTLSAKQLATQIEWVNADFVYLNHLFSPYFVVYPLWLKFRKKIKGKVIVCPRGALYDSALSLKYYKKKPLLSLYKLLGIQNKVVFHATNQREQAAIEKYFPGSNIVIADNLPSTKQDSFQSIKKEPGSLNCIFIARIVPIKNLLFLLNVLQNIKEHILLTVAGPVENENYWDECKKVIEALPANIEVKYIGARKNEELAGLIQQHHLFILPTTGENFGHSIFEALLAGRPVLISNQTPWLHLQDKNAGWDLPLTEPGKFEEVITTAAGFNQQQFDLDANAAWHYAGNFIHQSTSKQQYYTLFS